MRILTLSIAAQAWGQINGLVNNAAQFVFGKIEDVSSEDWTRVFGTNVMGYAFCIKAAVAHMKQCGGSIVNMSSISGHIAQPGFTPYVPPFAQCVFVTSAQVLHVQGRCGAAEQVRCSRLRRESHPQQHNMPGGNQHACNAASCGQGGQDSAAA